MRYDVYYSYTKNKEENETDDIVIIRDFLGKPDYFKTIILIYYV